MHDLIKLSSRIFLYISPLILFLFIFLFHSFFLFCSFSSGMQDLFEITLEATHHGPYVELPTCFVEIGKIMRLYTSNCILLLV